MTEHKDYERSRNHGIEQAPPDATEADAHKGLIDGGENKAHIGGVGNFLLKKTVA